MATQEKPNFISTKVENLKRQGDVLSKGLFTKIEELDTECQQALQAANNNRSVASMVAFRLDTFSDLLQSFHSKIQDGSHIESDRSGNAIHSASGDLVSSLLQRLEKVEKMCDSNSASYNQVLSSQELEKHKFQSSIDMLEKQTAQLQQKMCDTQNQTAQLQQDMSNAQKQTGQIQQEMSDAHKLNAQLHEKISDIESQHTDVKQKFEGLTNSVVVFHKTTDDLSTKVSSQQSQADIMAEEVMNLNNQIKHAKSKQKTLKQRIIKAQAENDEASKSLAKRVSGLEKLRKILKEEGNGAQGGSQVRQMCEDAQRELKVLTDDICKLSLQIGPFSRSHVGFTALLKSSRNLQAGSNIKKMFDVVANVGNCFRPAQGHFIAPYAGLYCFFVKLIQECNVPFSVSIMCKQFTYEAEEKLEIPVNSDAPHSSLCIIVLNTNDRVFLKIVSAEDTVELTDSVCFAGWSTSYF
ncbi:hypothetical protein PoB_002514600 [Plakobranchus ocellatus]|uniref:C1q domain-containing protein n=1 Tax=Plakobranchus ocellatus TaxID=259542 RepID=A0AAV3ZRP6_9GAST|nr:hypothetical protein PoB_002514600 [Plakobranchus ocellatus]